MHFQVALMGHLAETGGFYGASSGFEGSSENVRVAATAFARPGVAWPK